MVKKTEITKQKIDRKLDILFAISVLWYNYYDGHICDKCGIVQGESRKGWKKYYCKHYEKKVNDKIGYENNEILRDELGFISLKTRKTEVRK